MEEKSNTTSSGLFSDSEVNHLSFFSLANSSKRDSLLLNIKLTTHFSPLLSLQAPW